MTNQLHFRGDVTAAVADMIADGTLFGPDSCGPKPPGQIVGRGAYYSAPGATYADDVTTVQLRPVPPAELLAQAEERREDTFAKVVERWRVAEMFGGQP